MGIVEFIKKEADGWGKIERVLFPLGLLIITAISVYMNDSKIALVSAVCGISYTILAGKGKISCYFFGLCGTLCYAYLSFKNHLWGNLFLYALYYSPCRFWGYLSGKNTLTKIPTKLLKQNSTKKREICMP